MHAVTATNPIETPNRRTCATNSHAVPSSIYSWGAFSSASTLCWRPQAAEDSDRIHDTKQLPSRTGDFVLAGNGAMKLAAVEAAVFLATCAIREHLPFTVKRTCIKLRNQK